MTGPPLSSLLPSLHRIPTPDEFDQYKQMSPDAIAANPLPAIPAAPRDAIRADDPNATADKGKRLTGFARILTQYVAQPIMDHPLTSAVAPLVPGAGYLGAAMMGKDVLEYSAQKAAELSLPEDTRKLAEQDPDRISGESAAVKAAMLGLAPAVHGAMKAADRFVGTEGATPIEQSRSTALSPLDQTPATKITPEKAAQVEQAIALGNARRAMRPAIEAHANAVADAVQAISPQLQTENIVRANAGQSAAVREQAFFQLDEFRRAIEHLPYADKLGFVDAIENGESQPAPEFAKPADYMRKALDAQRDRVQGLGTGALDRYIEDYFPHQWEDPERAATALEARTQLASRAPFEGSKSSLQARTIPTTLEGIQLGLVPKFTNPVDQFLYKLADMEKYITAHRSINEMDEAGLTHLVPFGEQGPEGWAPINDKVARKGSAGTLWAPKDAANTINNYLSPGLAQTLRNTVPGPKGELLAQSYDMYRQLGNSLNQAQLGLSAFHVGTTTINSVVSRAALGLEELASGRPLTAIADMFSAPAAPIGNMIEGAKIRSAYLNPDMASPQYVELANAVKEAGGRVRQDSFYKGSYPEKMVDAWKAGDVATAARLSVPALFEAASRPIMEHIVPLEKLGAFGDLAKNALADLPIDATLAERRAALSLAWNSVDNRFGQLVYDNLFWNKVAKDLAMASTRSVGWNLGTIREIGGGIADAPSLLHGELTHRTAYTVALPITIGLYGAVYQMLRTGEPPSELKDYFYPKTGSVDADGNPDRVQLPSYAKDVVSYATHPLSTVEHKASPLLSGILEMLSNQDFYGNEIRNPNDPLVKQIDQEAEYMWKSLEPFTFRNTSEQSARGDTGAATKIGGWFGITPAPRRAVISDAQKMMQDFNSQRTTGATPEDAEARQARSELLNAIRNKAEPADIEAKVTAALESHNITPPEIGRLLKRAGSTPAQEQFKRLTLPQAVEVFKASTEREKAKFAQLLSDKIEKAAK